MRVYDWAVKHDSREDLCWCAVANSRLIMASDIERQSEVQAPEVERLKRCRDIIEEGLRTARHGGFSIHHIDLLLLRASLALREGRADDARRDIMVALEEGIDANAEADLPKLLAATHAECAYTWGIAEGCYLFGEASLLQAAQQYGQPNFNPTQFDQLPVNIRNLIEYAREKLVLALNLWAGLRDPTSDTKFNYCGQRAQQALNRLDEGVLTFHSLSVANTPDTDAQSR